MSLSPLSGSDRPPISEPSESPKKELSIKERVVKFFRGKSISKVDSKSAHNPPLKSEIDKTKPLKELVNSFLKLIESKKLKKGKVTSTDSTVLTKKIDEVVTESLPVPAGRIKKQHSLNKVSEPPYVFTTTSAFLNDIKNLKKEIKQFQKERFVEINNKGQVSVPERGLGSDWREKNEQVIKFISGKIDALSLLMSNKMGLIEGDVEKLIENDVKKPELNLNDDFFQTYKGDVLEKDDITTFISTQIEDLKDILSDSVFSKKLKENNSLEVPEDKPPELEDMYPDMPSDWSPEEGGLRGSTKDQSDL